MSEHICACDVPCPCRRLLNEARARVAELQVTAAAEAQANESHRKGWEAADARVAELEADLTRLGKTGAERYWEARWRDEAKHVESREVERDIYRALALRHEAALQDAGNYVALCPPPPEATGDLRIKLLEQRERIAQAARAILNAPANAREGVQPVKRGVDPDQKSKVSGRPDKCPSCGSPDPARHPGVQYEVRICSDPFHAPANAREVIANQSAADNGGNPPGSPGPSTAQTQDNATPRPATVRAGAEAMREAILRALPGGTHCDPQEIADMIRAIPASAGADWRHQMITRCKECDEHIREVARPLFGNSEPDAIAAALADSNFIVAASVSVGRREIWDAALDELAELWQLSSADLPQRALDGLVDMVIMLAERARCFPDDKGELYRRIEKALPGFPLPTLLAQRMSETPEQERKRLNAEWLAEYRKDSKSRSRFKWT